MKHKLFSFIAAAVMFIIAASTVQAQETVQVKQGDTLWSISQAYGVSVNDLKAWNNLTSDLIKAGTNLAISTTVRAESVETTSAAPAGKEMTVEASAYTASCKGCSGITSTGINLKQNPNAKVIAVDPNVIPLGTQVYVEGYGYAVAGDTGGSIKGNKIDVFFPNRSDALQWGRKQVKITILN